MSIGRYDLMGGASTGIPLPVTYDGLPEWHTSITIGWDLVAAVAGADVVTPAEGMTVPIGSKYLRYGQVITQVTTAFAQTITVTGVPTGGTFALNVANPKTGETGIITLAFNSSVADTQTALRAFFGATGVTVTGAGALPANVQTATFGGLLADTIIPLFTLAENGLTGGTAPTATFAAVTTANAHRSGVWGPYSNAASDGRQTLARGRVAILNTTILEASRLGLGAPWGQNTKQLGAITGGKVWRPRVLANDSAGSLAAGPLWSDLLAAMPRLYPVRG
jgi:hypothetical protein